MVSGDSAYGGKSVLSKLPANVHLISHVHCKGALYEPLPPANPDNASPGKKAGKGRPRKKGARLPSMIEWANDATKPAEELSSSLTIWPSDRPSRRNEQNKMTKSCTAPPSTTPIRIHNVPGR